ncbi:MAG: hypothetical protein OXC31_16080 [Spirochaetaceae bacterium]|nr:hypothetical protein [Spirochaetaceae bacterium]
MADQFEDQLRAELDGIQAQLERLALKRQLIEELLSLESPSNTTPATTKPRAKRQARRQAQAQATKRPRLPRGLISAKIREFLGQQAEPVHATKILAYLEQHQATPRSAKPMATLQSNLQRLKETGELENAGRNHWRLVSSAETAAAPAPTVPSDAPPVVTSTTLLGSRSSAGI